MAAPLDHKDPPALKVRKAPLVQRVRLGLKDRLVRPVPRDRRAPRETLATQAQQGPLAHRVPRGPRETQATQARQGQQGQLVLKARQDRLAPVGALRIGAGHGVLLLPTLR